MTADIDTRLEAARVRLDAQLESARVARADLAQAADELRSVTATVVSDRGQCAVTARSDGAITEVQLRPGVEAGTSLAIVLTRTIALAQSAAREAAVERASVLLGAESPVVTQFGAFDGAGAV